DASVPQAFSNAVARSIAKDRSERQSTAEELEKELVGALAAEGIALSDSVAGFAPEHTPGGSHGAVTSPQQTASTLVTGISETEPVRAPAPTIPSQAATMPTVVSPPREAVAPSVFPATMASLPAAVPATAAAAVAPP